MAGKGCVEAVLLDLVEEPFEVRQGRMVRVQRPENSNRAHLRGIAHGRCLLPEELLLLGPCRRL